MISIFFSICLALDATIDDVKYTGSDLDDIITTNKLTKSLIQKISLTSGDFDFRKMNTTEYSSLTYFSIELAVSTSPFPESFFENHTTIQNVAIQSLISIVERAFYNCTNLTTVNFPAVTQIYSYAFYNCINLSQLTLGDIDTLYPYCFARTAIETVNLPNLINQKLDKNNIAAYYSECKNLKEFKAAKITKIEDYTLWNCPLLNVLDTPLVSVIGNYGLTNDKVYKTLNLGNITEVGAFGFYGLKLDKVDFPYLSKIGKASFGASELSEIIENRSSILII